MVPAGRTAVSSSDASSDAVPAGALGISAVASGAAATPADNEEPVQGGDRDDDPRDAPPGPLLVTDDCQGGEHSCSDEPDDANLLLVLVEVEPVGGDAVLRALGRQEEPRGEVEDEAGETDERQHRDDDPDDDRVDVQVLRGTGADAGDDTVVAGALHVGDGAQSMRIEAILVVCLVRAFLGLVHVSIVVVPPPQHYRVRP
jgi:hypothetical protein